MTILGVRMLTIMQRSTPLPGWLVWPPVDAPSMMDEITGEVLVAQPNLDLLLLRKSQVILRCMDNNSGEPVKDCRCGLNPKPLLLFTSATRHYTVSSNISQGRVTTCHNLQTRKSSNSWRRAESVKGEGAVLEVGNSLGFMV